MAALKKACLYDFPICNKWTSNRSIMTPSGLHLMFNLFGEATLQMNCVYHTPAHLLYWYCTTYCRVQLFLKIWRFAALSSLKYFWSSDILLSSIIINSASLLWRHQRFRILIWYLFANNVKIHLGLSLIHIWRCRRYSLCRSRWSPYH